MLSAPAADTDAPHVDVIVATVPEDDGSIGAVVRDRLERAARG